MSEATEVDQILQESRSLRDEVLDVIDAWCLVGGDPVEGATDAVIEVVRRHGERCLRRDVGGAWTVGYRETCADLLSFSDGSATDVTVTAERSALIAQGPSPSMNDEVADAINAHCVVVGIAPEAVADAVLAIFRRHAKKYLRREGGPARTAGYHEACLDLLRMLGSDDD